MITSFQLSNVCGTFYYGGNIVFSSRKNVLFSPIGNRVKVIDLEQNTSKTLITQTRSNINNLCISPNSQVLIAVDDDGFGVIINLMTQQEVNRISFKERVKDIKYSPDGQFLAVSHGLTLRIFQAPAPFKSFEPLLLFQKFKGMHSEHIQSIQWSPDSRFIATCGQDLNCQLFCLHRIQEFIPYTFSVNKQVIIKSFWSDDMKYFYTIDRDAVLCVWKWVDDVVSTQFRNLQKFSQFKSGKKIKLEGGTESFVPTNTVLNGEDGVVAEEDLEEEEAGVNDDQEAISKQKQGSSKIDELEIRKEAEDEHLKSLFEQKVGQGRFVLQQKHKFYQKSFSKLQSCEFSLSQKQLVLGFQNGSFSLHRVHESEITEIQKFSLGSAKISTVAQSASGSWIAFGIKSLGQLIVWEWRSQTYILNQQCLTHDITCSAFSIDGSIIATGGLDGRLRLWDTQSNLCFSTLTGHESKITGLVFSSRANTVLTCSNDGTVRAFDTLRFKCFRTMKPDLPTQFSCISVDPSGEIVCAGGIDPYDIYCWNIQTGNLVDLVSGHQAPVSCIAFSGIKNVLYSAGWDMTLRVHDLYSRQNNTEILQHTSEITAIAVRPDGKELSCATLKGEIYIWNGDEGSIIGTLDCRRDLGGGRMVGDRFVAQNSSQNKHFQTLCYTSDGDYLLAGGNSKNVCLYELKHRILLKKFKLTDNRSLDGILHQLNSKNLKDGVTMNEINDYDDSDYEERKDKALPGSKNFDVTQRNVKLAVQARCVNFSPGEDSWTVATSEGLFIFSHAKKEFFSPYELDEDISLSNITKSYSEGDYARALVTALKLNNKKFITEILMQIPRDLVKAIAKFIPVYFLNNLFSILAEQVSANEQAEYLLYWAQSLLFSFSEHFQNLQITEVGPLKTLLKNINQRFNEVDKISQRTIFKLEFILRNIHPDKVGARIEDENTNFF